MSIPNIKKLRLLGSMERVYPFPWYIAEQALTKDLKPILGENMTETLILLQKDTLQMFYDLDDFDRMGKAVLKKNYPRT